MLHKLQFGFKSQVPVILQSETAECGLACLAMILNYYGHLIDIATLRRQQEASLQGVTLQNLVYISRNVGFNPRAIRLDLEDIEKLSLPCILHWNLNHFVVLIKTKGTYSIIHDPARGQRRIRIEELSRAFTGIALEVTPTEHFKKRDERNALRLRDMFHHISGLQSSLVYLFFLSIVIEIISLISPIANQIIIDDVLVSKDTDLLLTISIIMIIVICIQILISTVRSWAVVMFSTRVSIKWSSSLFDHLIHLPLEYFSKRHIGDILSRFGSLSTIQNTLTTDLVQSILDGIMAVGMGIMLFLYGGWLGAVACAAIVLDIMLRFITYANYRRASEESVVQSSKSQTIFIETLRNITTVKLLNLHEKRQTVWLNSIIDSTNVHLRLQRFDLVFNQIASAIFGLDGILILGIGSYLVMHEKMSIGTLVAFLSYKEQFASRVSSLINTGFKLRMLNIQTQRLSDIVMTKAEKRSIKQVDSTHILPHDSILSARNLSFRYASNRPWIFQNLSFDIPLGTNVAIIGPSGCGKTSLLKILMGLIPPTKGEVFIHNKDRHRPLNDYQNYISGVLQEDGLFSGSIIDNISGFEDHLDQSLIEECARKASIHDYIKTLPMGYETLVGDMGSTFSGGQKQRIILARAFYRCPKLLFLDEATSHLDEETEREIAHNLNSMEITRVIVAHRMATVEKCDFQIILG